MSAARTCLSRARVEALAAEIREVGRIARYFDPATKGDLSYPAMCGGLKSVLHHLVREAADDTGAEAVITQAFEDAYRDTGATGTEVAP